MGLVNTGFSSSVMVISRVIRLYQFPRFASEGFCELGKRPETRRFMPQFQRLDRNYRQLSQQRNLLKAPALGLTAFRYLSSEVVPQTNLMYPVLVERHLSPLRLEEPRLQHLRSCLQHICH